MTPKLPRAFALVAVSAMWIAGTESALAQTAEVDQGRLEEIVVTGSRIARRDFSSPSPISTVTREALDTAAQRTLRRVRSPL